MTTDLSRFFRQRREARKPLFGDVARLLGCTNVAKGANKVIEFERDARIHPELFRKLAAVLEISAEDIRPRVQICIVKQGRMIHQSHGLQLEVAARKW